MREIDFINLRRLWSLKLVYDYGSIKKVAVQTKVTSSAVSQSISNLEKSTGRKLVIRKNNQFVPTEYGRQLVQSAAKAFDHFADLHGVLTQSCVKIPRIDWLDFATTESLAVEILPEIVKRLRVQYPAIRLKVKTGRSCQLTKQVRKGELCMALVEENDEMDGVTKILITRERLGFYCSSQNKGEVSFEKLASQIGVGVLSPGSFGHLRSYSKFIRCLGTRFKPTLLTESYEILRKAAVENSVIAVLPTRVARRSLQDLREVLHPAMKSLDHYDYGIYLVCEPGCSKEENEYLGHELRSIIGSSMETH